MSLDDVRPSVKRQFRSPLPLFTHSALLSREHLHRLERQAHFIALGMRVRKAVSDGYQVVEASPWRTYTQTLERHAELRPYCVGSRGQEGEEREDDGGWDVPGLSSSQETVDDGGLEEERAMPVWRTQGLPKRRFDDDDRDGDIQDDETQDIEMSLDDNDYDDGEPIDLLALSNPHFSIPTPTQNTKDTRALRPIAQPVSRRARPQRISKTHVFNSSGLDENENESVYIQDTDWTFGGSARDFEDLDVNFLVERDLL